MFRVTDKFYNFDNILYFQGRMKMQFVEIKKREKREEMRLTVDNLSASVSAPFFPF